MQRSGYVGKINVTHLAVEWAYCPLLTSGTEWDKYCIGTAVAFVDDDYLRKFSGKFRLHNEIVGDKEV
jgi:hypothetical protein